MKACCIKNKRSHLYSARQTSYIHTERNKGNDMNEKEREKQWRNELIDKGGKKEYER
jgi:hypothetical protein